MVPSPCPSPSGFALPSSRDRHPTRIARRDHFLDEGIELRHSTRPDATRAARKATGAHLKAAVHRARPLSRAGLLERMFTFAFSKLVYPQIWEDPVVDMKALGIGPGHEVIAIASGGCNVLSYLTADPAGVTAVDLNGAHVALGRLKICALQNLPDHDAFFRFFGRAAARANVADYDRRLRMKLDPETRAYWDKRRTFGRRRIGVFAHNVYRHGLLGHFLGAGHVLAKLHGIDPAVILEARTLEEQRALYEERLAPVFDKPLVRWMMKQPASLYGLGIPPAQYQALAGDSPRGIGAVLSAAGRAPRLRLSAVRQLFRLAGVRPELRAGARAGRCRPTCSARISRRCAPRGSRPLRARAASPTS